MPPSGDATPLRPSDFSFYGFDDLLPGLERSLGDLSIRHGEPGVEIVENAVFVPPVEMEERGKFEGAVLTEDGAPIAAAQAERRFGAFGSQTLGALSEPVEVAPSAVVEEEVVYLGWFIGHFGHFLLESLARVWFLERIDPAIKVVFHVERERYLKGSLSPILALFGIPPDRVLLLDRQTVLRRVLIPEPLYEISHAAHERMPSPFRRVAGDIAGGVDRSEQPLYLSRRMLSSMKRQIVGEFEMEEIFRENGFLVAHPETMSFREQVRLINRHRDVFTTDGTAAYLTLFALQPPRLHVLTSDVPIPDYFLVPKAEGAEAWYSNCLRGEEDPSLYYMPPVVQMETLAGYLESHGLLRARLRTSLATRASELESAYGAARMYTLVQHHIVRGELSEQLEADAQRWARSSWPIGWVLSCYYAFRQSARTEPAVLQFIDLLAQETDVNRLAHYFDDVNLRAAKVASRCGAATAARLAEVMGDRFEIEVIDREQRAELRRARLAARAERLAARAAGG